VSGLNNPQIAVDITGGTKVMSVGAAMAVSLLGGQTFYILSGATKDDIQQRRVGTEEPRKLADPYSVFGDLDHAEAQRLFNPPRYNYASAAQIWRKLVRRENMSRTLKSRYTLHEALASTYAAWDSFDMSEAKEQMERVVRSPAYRDLTHQKVLQQQQQTIEQLEGMNRLLSGKGGPTLKLLQQIETVLALLGSLYHNGLRRAAQERYDLAALMVYRCLELISQSRLAQYDISTDKPDYTLAYKKVPQLDKAYRNALKAKGRTEKFDVPSWSIGLFTGYVLLEALKDPLVVDYPVAQIEQRTKARNHSMLAHGLRFISQDEYDLFASMVNDILERFFCVEKQDINYWKQVHTFVCL